MAKKYTLYELLFEDAAMASRLTNTPPLSKKDKTQGFDSKQLIKGMQGGLEKEIKTVANLASKTTEIEKKDVEAAKKASDEVEKLIGSIAAVSGHSVKAEEPQPQSPKTQEIPKVDQEQIRRLSQQAKTPTNDIGTAKTEPALRRPSTQPVPQAEVEAAIEADRLQQQRQANIAAYPEAERQRQQAIARAQAARTEQMPATKPGMIQRLRQRIGLEEEIKKAFKAGMRKS